jgi:hypothetical protein
MVSNNGKICPDDYFEQGSILFIEFSYEPNVQPQTVSGWSSYRQTKTPNRQFFFRAVSRDTRWTYFF